MGEADDGQAILKRIMADGTFDELRQKVVEELKKDVSLQNTATSLVKSSTALSKVDFQRANRRAVLEAVRKEVETDVLDTAYKIVWSLLSGDGAISKTIDEKVQTALRALYEEKYKQQQHQVQQHYLVMHQPSTSQLPHH